MRLISQNNLRIELLRLNYSIFECFFVFLIGHYFSPFGRNISETDILKVTHFVVDILFLTIDIDILESIIFGIDKARFHAPIQVEFHNG